MQDCSNKGWEIRTKYGFWCPYFGQHKTHTVICITRWKAGHFIFRSYSICFLNALKLNVTIKSINAFNIELHDNLKEIYFKQYNMNEMISFNLLHQKYQSVSIIDQNISWQFTLIFESKQIACWKLILYSSIFRSQWFPSIYYVWKWTS